MTARSRHRLTAHGCCCNRCPLETVETLVGGYKLVDANKQAIAYVYAMPIRAMPLGAGASEEEYNVGRYTDYFMV